MNKISIDISLSILYNVEIVKVYFYPPENSYGILRWIKLATLERCAARGKKFTTA